MTDVLTQFTKSTKTGKSESGLRNDSAHGATVTGLTLVETLVAMSIAGFIIAGAISSIIFFYQKSVMSAYESGAVRVLQTHVERIQNLQLSQITNSHIINFNFSGLRMTTMSDGEVQGTLTNQQPKTFIFSTLPTNAVLTINQTNTTEAAVMAYLTAITVVDLSLTNNVLGETYAAPYKHITVRTFWHAMGRNRTNSVTLLRYKNK